MVSREYTERKRKSGAFVQVNCTYCVVHSGRGRTTTGLIVTCLFRTRLMSFDVGLPAIIKSESIAQLEMEDIQYHKGEYKVISWVEYTLLC